MPEYYGMRILFSVSFLLLWIEINCGALKTSDPNRNHVDKAIYPKGINSMKNLRVKSLHKNRIDLEEKFRDLPESDLAFIKDLDKQFTKYGAKVKIKVENGNVTAKRKGKNGLKRTLEKSLGYGYSKQYDKHNHYEYNAPKYMIYPYSQEDIVPQTSYYYLPQKKPITTVSIEPSYSFELETETYIQPPDHQTQHESVQQEPVLILNVPGSQEYADHLKNLLQQYLELKSAQYSQYLGEQTQSHTKPKYNINEPEPLPEIQYVYHKYMSQNPALYEQQPQENYHENVNDDQSYYESSAIADNAPKYYQNYDGNVKQPVRPVLYYIPDKQYAQGPIGQDGQNGNSNFTQIFLLSAPIRHQPHLIYVTEDYNQKASGGSALRLTENNPRNSHTRVIFTQNTKHASTDYRPDYLLPSIKPKEFQPAASIPIKHQDFQVQTAQQDATESESKSNKDQIITITQRPFNYHAHYTKQYPNGRHDITVLTTYK